MERYATQGPGIGGRLRASPADFVVEEIPRPPAVARGPGKYTIVTLRATNWETNKLVGEMGRKLGVSRRGIFFTGTKDKRAVKTQQMAILAPEERVRSLQLPGVEVLDTFRADRAPKLGDLVGNRFRITVRDLAAPVPEAARRCEAIVAELSALGGMPNYFGLQRFGVLRPVTHVVGERIVRGDLEGAVMAYLGGPQEAEPADAFEARRRIQEERDYGKALTYFPQHLTFERVLLQHLSESPGDWKGALRKLPLNLVTMFIYAYQSLLFNRILSARLGQPNPGSAWEGDLVLPVDELGVPDHDTVIPVRSSNLEKCRRQVERGHAVPTALVFGADVRLAEGPMGLLEQRIVREAGIDARAFLTPHMPELASFGQRRAILVQPRDLAPVEHADAIELRFGLPKGSYATCFLREIMKAPADAY